MKTLNITPYDFVVGRTPDGKDITNPYPIRDSIANILFNQQGLKARELLRRDDIARKVFNAAADATEVVFEDDEFAQLKASVEALEGYGRQDVELVRRVMAVE